MLSERWEHQTKTELKQDIRKVTLQTDYGNLSYINKIQDIGHPRITLARQTNNIRKLTIR